MLNLVKKKIEAVYSRFVDHPYRMQHIQIMEREVLGSCQSLLDLGCGDGNHVASLGGHLNRMVGVDLFEPSLILARKKNIYQEVFSQNVLEVGNVFPNNSFDCVIAFDLIEHFNKADGYRLMNIMEKIAKKKVIIFTPNGFLPQTPFANNQFQVHLSGWTPNKMRSMGYHVYGIHGLKGLLGERQIPRFRPHRLCITLSVITQIICLQAPEIAFQILCIKEIG